MYGVQSSELAAEARNRKWPLSASLSKDKVPALSRALILRFLAKRCKNFRSHLEAASSKSERDSTMIMSIFRYPLVTYLTSTTIVELGRGLMYSIDLIDKSNIVHEQDLLSILSLLELVNANIKALHFCSINLTSLLRKESEYKAFMDAFQKCIVRLARGGEKAERGADEAQKVFWSSITSVS